MKRIFLFALPLALLTACTCPCKKQAREDFSKFVNPFIGCSYNGHTFPGATYPFGSVQPSPDTGYGDWQHCSGYVYSDKSILGFSQTHISGTGCSDFGDVLLLPFTGDVKDDAYLSGYDKATEKAEPGFYGVTLKDFGVGVELTASPHVAFHRYTFTQNTPARVLVDLQYGNCFTKKGMHTHVLEAESAMEGTQTITGHNRVKNWVDRQYYFVIQFNRPFVKTMELPKKTGEKAARYVLDFGLKSGETLEAKIALSTVSVEGAKKNMAQEAPGWNFDGMRLLCKNAWNELFSRAAAEGSKDQKENFYTSMYHLFIQPNNIANVDGQYRGADDKVMTAPDKVYYSTLSCWDTFRAAHPLYTILTPERVNGFVSTMIAQQKAVGFVPVWALGGKDNYCMIGNHSIPVIVDAYSKGFRGFSGEDAFRAIDGSLRVMHKGKPKENWDLYDKYGYYPYDLVKGESVSRTLECGEDDWCAAWLAKALGKKDAADFYTKRSNDYKNLFDKSTGFMRGKNSKGQWRDPFDPFLLGHGAGMDNDYTEGNSWQYTWHVMQDPEGLISLFGGKDAFANKLTQLFDQPEVSKGKGWVSDVTGLIGQYAHGNEPSHHTIYFFDYAGRPWKTQELVRKVFDTQYHNTVDGLCGNDDCGQMSAWYLFSAMGFYPFNPAASGYVFGAPQLPKITLKLPGGRVFTVEAKGLSVANKYVQGVTLNGKAVQGFKLSHAQIMAGGSLVFQMGPDPVKE